MCGISGRSAWLTCWKGTYVTSHVMPEVRTRVLYYLNTHTPCGQPRLLVLVLFHRLTVCEQNFTTTTTDVCVIFLSLFWRWLLRNVYSFSFYVHLWVVAIQHICYCIGGHLWSSTVVATVVNCMGIPRQHCHWLIDCGNVQGWSCGWFLSQVWNHYQTTQDIQSEMLDIADSPNTGL